MHGDDMTATAAPIKDAEDAQNDENSSVEEQLAETRRQLDDAHKVMWSLYKELDDKKGSIELEIKNLFGHEFNWVTDQFIIDGRVPDREVRLSLNLSF